MTSHSTAEVARIAAGLTKAQREALKLHEPAKAHSWLTTPYRQPSFTFAVVGHPLVAMGLLKFEKNPFSAATIITSLGLAVRAHREAKLLTAPSAEASTTA